MSWISLSSMSARIKDLARIMAELSLSAVLICALSKAIYNEGNLQRIRNFTNCSTGNNCKQLEKMRSLWPPPTHPAIYLLLALGCHFLNSRVISLFDGIRMQLLELMLASVACFVWLIMPERLAEMHSAVLAINIVHTVASLYATYISFWLFNRCKNKLKSE